MVVQDNNKSHQSSEQILVARTKLEKLKTEIHKVIVGQDNLISRLLIALIADGHILLEGVPGIAKTLTVNTLARALQLDFKRIQFTPDLLPSDLTGISIYNPKEGVFSIQKGPVFTNIVLADEVNRAPPKVQSALLEVMGERQVTISGQTFKTSDPFLVLATENPIEQEGTYPLPEAVTDRFMMKVIIGYPQKEEEKEIVLRHGMSAKPIEITRVLDAQDIFSLRQAIKDVYIDDKVLGYIIDIVFATRDTKGLGALGKLLSYGASPRASLALSICSKAHALLDGRSYVTPFDVKEIATDVLRHRLVLSYEAEAQEITSDDIIKKIFDTVPVP
jgi:MoxR-like ATPase